MRPTRHTFSPATRAEASAATCQDDAMNARRGSRRRSFAFALPALFTLLALPAVGACASESVEAPDGAVGADAALGADGRDAAPDSHGGAAGQGKTGHGAPASGPEGRPEGGAGPGCPHHPPPPPAPGQHPACMGPDGAVVPCAPPPPPPPCAHDVDRCFHDARGPEDGARCEQAARDCRDSAPPPAPPPEQNPACMGPGGEVVPCAPPPAPPPCAHDVDRCFRDARGPEEHERCEQAARDCRDSAPPPPLPEERPACMGPDGELVRCPPPPPPLHPDCAPDVERCFREAREPGRLAGCHELARRCAEPR